MSRFRQVSPTVPVTDLSRALKFYRDVLGFEVSFTNGEPPSFAIIRHDDVQLHLQINPENAGTLHAHLLVDDLDEIERTLQQSHIPLLQPPTAQDWGLRDLIVRDFDGNTFEIAEPIRSPSN